MQRRFFLYILILFLTNQASIMGFRAIAAVCRAVVVSNMVRCQQRTPLGVHSAAALPAERAASRYVCLSLTL